MILSFLLLAFANRCSVVDLFLRYAAWDMGIAESNLELIRFIIETANIFLTTVTVSCSRFIWTTNFSDHRRV